MLLSRKPYICIDSETATTAGGICLLAKAGSESGHGK